MSAVLCPDCGLPMVWMRGRWRCQCRTELLEERGAARLDLLGVVYLPESVPSGDPEQWEEVAEGMMAERGLQRLEGSSWRYHPAEHAVAAWVHQPEVQQGWSAVATWAQEAKAIIEAWRRGEGDLAGLFNAWWEVASGRVRCDVPCARSVRLW